jgi:hypothetical protein
LRLLILAAALVSSTIAAPIAGLVNTGAGLGDGANDPVWSILSPSQQAVVIASSSVPVGQWVANDLVSRWIWETPTAEPINVTRTFRISFDLTGFNAATASINGRWTTDNTGLDILINGVGTTQTSADYTFWTNFAINGGFVSGVNTLDFVVNDVGISSGFRAEILSSNADALESATPEPAALALCGGGLLALGMIRRRR